MGKKTKEDLDDKIAHAFLECVEKGQSILCKGVTKGAIKKEVTTDLQLYKSRLMDLIRQENPTSICFLLDKEDILLDQDIIFIAASNKTSEFKKLKNLIKKLDPEWPIEEYLLDALKYKLGLYN